MLADPGIKLGRCDREQVAAGKVGSQALALLVFLSRSGLKPTVGELRCGSTERTAKGVVTTFPPPDTLYITAINGIPIAGHQGAGTITDITIRTLLTLQHQFAPKRIVSLMRYPGAPSTVAASDYSAYIKIELAKPASREDEQERRRQDWPARPSTSATAPLACQPDLEHARVAAADDTAGQAADAEAIDASRAPRRSATRAPRPATRVRHQRTP